MNGYKLIRYKGIAENGVVAATAPNGVAKPNGTAAANGTAASKPAADDTAAAAPQGRKTAKPKVRAATPPKRVVRGVTIIDRRTSW
jgi:hypothetical protein